MRIIDIEPIETSLAQDIKTLKRICTKETYSYSRGFYEAVEDILDRIKKQPTIELMTK